MKYCKIIAVLDYNSYMQIPLRHIAFHRYTLKARTGFYIQLTDSAGHEGWGECAPLPGFSQETLQECLLQFVKIQGFILKTHWKKDSLFDDLTELKLLPALSFALESALLHLLDPIEEHSIKVSALFLGSPREILAQAKLREKEGYTSAKLKVGHLRFDDAAILIHQLKKRFHLRIDVNRAWQPMESLRFFSQFGKEDFDYIEEPFANPEELGKFTLPFAVDESFPSSLQLAQLERLPNLKALVYKPTIQGGMSSCIPLKQWTEKNGVSLILSSSFESPLGLAKISSMAHRLNVVEPVGLGTIHHL